MKRVCVIGAGISGLSTAYYLRKFFEKAGIPLRLRVIESNSEPGGKMKTVFEDGYIVETGPNGFLDNKPDTLELVKDLGIEGKLYRSSDEARKRFIYSNGKLVRLPEGVISFLFSPLLSLKGKLRLMSEVFVPKKQDTSDESVSEFARRRLGSEALEKLLEPMVAGVYAGDPDRMSLKASFPTIYNLEVKYGGLIKGFFGLIKERKKKKGSGPAGPGGTLTSFIGGVSDLIRALSKYLEEELKTGVPVEGVKREGNVWKVVLDEREEEFDVLILSVPAYAAAELMKDVNRELSENLSGIEYSPISVVSLGFDEEGIKEKVDGFGFLIPRKEGRRILGVLWDSSIFPNRAPKGKVLMRVMIGGARQPELALLPEEELVKVALEELRDIMEIQKEPDFIKVFKHEKGIPHYTIGHVERVERILKKAEELGNLFFNSNAYRGIGLNDCIANAKRTALRVLEISSSR